MELNNEAKKKKKKGSATVIFCILCKIHLVSFVYGVKSGHIYLHTYTNKKYKSDSPVVGQFGRYEINPCDFFKRGAK